MYFVEEQKSKNRSVALRFLSRWLRALAARSGRPPCLSPPAPAPARQAAVLQVTGQGQGEIEISRFGACRVFSYSLSQILYSRVRRAACDAFLAFCFARDFLYLRFFGGFLTPPPYFLRVVFLLLLVSFFFFLVSSLSLPRAGGESVVRRSN